MHSQKKKKKKKVQMTLERSLKMDTMWLIYLNRIGGRSSDPASQRKHQGTLTDNIIGMNNNSHPNMTHQVYNQLHAI
jgi:hypothetical protein